MFTKAEWSKSFIFNSIHLRREWLHAWFNTSDSYTRLVLAYWQFRPDLGAKQAILLTLAWVHGCMGLHFWLRLKPWYPRVVSLLFGIALLVPVLALLGFAQAGREVSRLSQEEGWLDLRMHLMRTPEPHAARFPGTRQRHYPGRIYGQYRAHTGCPCGAAAVGTAASDASCHLS